MDVEERETIFQAKLEQLEAGTPLETCLVGLGAEDAAALQFIATIRAAAFPAQDPETVMAYRTRVLHKVVQEGKMASVRQTPTPKHSLPTVFDQLRRQLDWLLTRRALAGVMVALFVGACLLVGGLAAIRLGTGGSNQDIAGVGSDSDLGKTPEATDSSADNPIEESGVPRETVVAALPHEIFVPVMPNPVVFNATTAVIQGVRGRVEVQTSDGSWTAILETGQLTAGQRVRTSDLSSAVVAYFDGSQAILGANSELVLDELNAQRPENGFRTVVMTQVAGESEHHVAFRNDGGSRYEVKTSAGNGVARGTIFHVLVTPDLRARFTVNEGKIDVSNLNSTVSVLAGQLTQAMVGRAPTTPAFRISGEGLVTQIGATWTIAGQSFQTDANTLILGAPQVSDLVTVEGYRTSDGVSLADRIVMLQPSNNSPFTLVGEVETINDTAWTVVGQTIVVNNDTQIDENIEIGNTVRVEGQVLPGGALLAEQIFRLQNPEGYPFQFNGVVQEMGNGTWAVSGQTVMVDEDTRIEDVIELGDVARIRGRILPNGTWLARNIRLVTRPTADFTLTGLVQNIDPWNIAGVSLVTRDWTIIEPGIEVGDMVRVHGMIRDDGLWLAGRIESLEEPPQNVIVLTGIVTSMEPWSVNGLPLVVNGSTVIGPGLTIGQIVIVHIQLRADGSWITLSIQPLRPQFGLGCLIFTAVVIQVSGNQVILQNWDPLVLGDNVEIQGDIQPNSIILFPICTWPNGTIIIINIVVIFQPVIIIINNGGGGTGLPPGCRITGHGSIKCSRRSGSSR